MRSRVTVLIVTVFGLIALASPRLTRPASAAQATLQATAAAAPSMASAAPTSPATPGVPAFAPAQSGAYLGVLTRSSGRGIDIIEVVPGSPADDAGLKVGDVIVSINAEAVSTAQPFSAMIGRFAPGTAIQVGIMRADGAHTVTVTLGKRPTAPLNPNATAAAPGDGAFLGVGLVESADGVRIEQVAPGSAAERAGLHVSDIVLSIDAQPITSVGQVRALLSAKQPGQTLLLTVKRADQTLSVSVTLTAPSVTIPNGPPVLPGAVPPYAPGAARVQLGVQYEVVTETAAAAHNLTVTNGALIIDVQPNSPAALAGIQPGDVVTEVDGDKVDAKHTLAVRMVAYSAGDTLTLTVVRGGQTLHVVVTLAARGIA